MKQIHLSEIPSTNTYAKEQARALLEAGEMPVCIRAYRQTGGRGQRGNSWESAPGKNLTISILTVPEGLRPAQQFSISEAVALGVCDLLAHYDIDARVKWPNDIYVGHEKIAGILIEHSLMGMGFQYTVAGIGLNVNQQTFLSDAPNPVSMAQITHPLDPANLCDDSAFGGYAAFPAAQQDPYDLDEVCERLCAAVAARMKHTADEDGRARLHSDFMGRLWRHDGAYHRFRNMLPGADTAPFEARIVGVDPSGHLRLETPEGVTHIFAFKEVAWL